MPSYTILYVTGPSASLQTTPQLRVDRSPGAGHYLHSGRRITSIDAVIDASENAASVEIMEATDIVHRAELHIPRYESAVSTLRWRVNGTASTILEIQPETRTVELDLVGDRDPQRVKVRITRPLSPGT